MFGRTTIVDVIESAFDEGEGVVEVEGWSANIYRGAFDSNQ